MDGNDTCLGSNLGTANSFLPSTAHHLQSLVTIIRPLTSSIVCQARPVWLNHFYSRSHTDWVESAPGFWALVLYSFQISILQAELLCREVLTAAILCISMRNSQQKRSSWEFCILPALCKLLLAWRKHMAEPWAQQGKRLWCELQLVSDIYS